MPRKPLSPLLPLLFTTGIVVVPCAQGAISLGVVQNYAVGGNNVDTNSSGNAIGSTALNDVAGFSTAVSSAFSSNTGGIIDFGTAGAGNVGTLNITYGGTKTFAINSTLDYAVGSATTSQNIDIRDNLSTLSPVSGITALLPNQANGAIAWTLNFGSISNGVLGEAITTAGFSLLSRSGTSQTVSVDWFIDGGTVPAFNDSEAIANSNGGDNTFFSYTAPTGSAITGFRVNFPAGGATLDRRLGIDDLGFITGVVPEPGVTLLSGIAAIAGLARRRRI